MQTTEDRIEQIRARADRLPNLGKRRLLAQARLKKLLIYAGPDPVIQEASYIALGRFMGYTPYPVHREIVRFQNQTTFGPRNKDMLLAFRGLGKSTYGHYTRAIGAVLRNPDIRILMASDTMPAAMGFHKEIRAHLVYNPVLSGLFGDFYPRNDDSVVKNDRESTISQRRNKTTKDATFTCLGIGNQGAGRHFDLIFCDDLVTQNESRTPTMREKLYDWHGSTLVGTMLPHTKVHYIGTRYWPNDLWQVLEEGTDDQKASGGPLQGQTLKIPICTYDAEGQMIPTHPERYPAAVIKDRLDIMGRYHFASQMLQDTSLGEGLVFNINDFRWYNRQTLPKDLVVYQFFDLAAKRTETGDFFCGVTIGVHNRRDVYLLEIFRERAGMERQREMIFRAMDKWRPVQCGIEAVQMQAGFAQEIQESGLNAAVPVPVEKDKVFRAMRVTPIVETGRVYLPEAECDPAETMSDFLGELAAFRGDPRDRDDQVDAFVGAVTLAIFGGGPAAMAMPEDERGHDDGLLADYNLD